MGRDESGQTMVEFMLTLLLAVTVVAGLSIGFKSSLYKFWRQLAKEISAPCPSCKSPVR